MHRRDAVALPLGARPANPYEDTAYFKWRRRESNSATSMIWALYHQGISHQSAIRRGEMGGPRALSCVASRHPAGTVDQRDHGGPAQRSQPRSMVPTSCSCSES